MLDRLSFRKFRTERYLASKLPSLVMISHYIHRKTNLSSEESGLFISGHVTWSIQDEVRASLKIRLPVGIVFFGR